jgi:hypothetical protein
LKWIKEGLVLRIISEEYMEGKYYNKKIIIKTIINDYDFLAVPFENISKSEYVLENLIEKDLETVLPNS